MTVSELIKTLALFPQNAPVLVDGYEGGYEDATRVDLALVSLNANVPAGSSGPHADWDGRTPRVTPCVIIRAEVGTK